MVPLPALSTNPLSPLVLNNKEQPPRNFSLDQAQIDLIHQMLARDSIGALEDFVKLTNEKMHEEYDTITDPDWIEAIKGQHFHLQIDIYKDLLALMVEHNKEQCAMEIICRRVIKDPAFVLGVMRRALSLGLDDLAWSIGYLGHSCQNNQEKDLYEPGGALCLSGVSEKEKTMLSSSLDQELFDLQQNLIKHQGNGELGEDLAVQARNFFEHTQLPIDARFSTCLNLLARDDPEFLKSLMKNSNVSIGIARMACRFLFEHPTSRNNTWTLMLGAGPGLILKSLNEGSGLIQGPDLEKISTMMRHCHDDATIKERLPQLLAAIDHYVIGKHLQDEIRVSANAAARKM